MKQVLDFLQILINTSHFIFEIYIKFFFPIYLQVVYIYRCENATVQIKGKANSITMGLIMLILLIYLNF